MIKLLDLEYVKGLQSNLRSTFGSAQGEEVMRFLEEAVGYDASIFDATNRDMVLINDGKRQVVATIKTLLKLTPEQVVAMAQHMEE